MNSCLKILLGLILVALGVYSMWFLRGQVPNKVGESIGVVVFSIGFVLLLMGLYEI